MQSETKTLEADIFSAKKAESSPKTIISTSKNRKQKAREIGCLVRWSTANSPNACRMFNLSKWPSLNLGFYVVFKSIDNLNPWLLSLLKTNDKLGYVDKF